MERKECGLIKEMRPLFEHKGHRAKGIEQTEKTLCSTWRVSLPSPEVKKPLENELKISSLLATLLINRGIDSVEGASLFLSSKLGDLHNPFLMKGMRDAVDRIIKAIVNGEGIGIYGDYDVDGITATTLLHLFFKQLGVDTAVYIPHRLEEGYGIKEKGILSLKEKGIGLIISADCGITSRDEIAFARARGIDFIVTDHHEVPDCLPPAYSIINPKQSDCPFPFKDISGVGVAFNLIIALRATMRDNGFIKQGTIPNLKEYLDLVALGTLADCVPLIDENRIFVKYGIKEIERGRRFGIKALREIAGIKGEINTGNITFQLIPRLNAPGRMGEEYLSFKLLTSGDLDEASSLARRLDELNTKRQAIEEKIWKDVQMMIEEMEDWRKERVIFLYSQDWHPGVIGIVASRVIDTYYRPAFLIALKEGYGRGSVRGIKGCNVVAQLKECAGFLEGFGGHSLAAGFTVREERLKGFEENLKRVALSLVKTEDLVPEIYLDAILGFDRLSEELIREIDTLAPYGVSNPEPVFGLEDIRVVNSRIVGSDHLNLYLEKDGHFFDAIGFGMGGSGKVISEQPEASNLKSIVSLAFTPFIDEWNGKKRVRLKIKDIALQRPFLCYNKYHADNLSRD